MTQFILARALAATQSVILVVISVGLFMSMDMPVAQAAKSKGAEANQRPIFVPAPIASAAAEREVVEKIEPSRLMIVSGEVYRVTQAKRWISVLSSGKKYSYIIKPDTQLMKTGEPVDFSSLVAGTRVRVIAERTGKKLDPRFIEVLE